MKFEYSLYEAKSRLSALIRQVREGHTLTITVHGVPVAELKPVDERASTLAERLRMLESRGEVSPAHASVNELLTRWSLGATPRKAGALDRFLADRE